LGDLIVAVTDEVVPIVDWKVYDVVIEDISLVNNYRAQFKRALAKSP